MLDMSVKIQVTVCDLKDAMQFWKLRKKHQ